MDISNFSVSYFVVNVVIGLIFMGLVVVFLKPRSRRELAVIVLCTAVAGVALAAFSNHAAEKLVATAVRTAVLLVIGMIFIKPAKQIQVREDQQTAE